MRYADLVATPFRVILKKGIARINREFNLLFRQLADRVQPTYSVRTFARRNFSGAGLESFWAGFDIPLTPLQSGELSALADYYIKHYFDLLGSGWIQVKHGMDCRGLEGFRYRMSRPVQIDTGGWWLEGRINQANLKEAKRIWQLVDRDYTPVDWHLDYKSGYRWSEKTYYRNIVYGHKPGVDIKVPWELSRMQHLPQLALTYRASAVVKPGAISTDIYIKEFRNQVLDFIATNPPRFGVNWHCTMDVAIRVSNWLVAYDIFTAGGAKFDSLFEQVFIRSIYEHGRHIIKNLEWNAGFRTNHYLADITGLLFVGAYLPATPETDSWLRFAVNELISEVKLQFYEDGANFEASTCYHRLAAEMIIYSTALVLGLPANRWRFLFGVDSIANPTGLKPERIHFRYPCPENQRCSLFPDWFSKRLEKMAEFTMHITKPNGHIPQFGDNDSGRFLKLQPVIHQLTVAQAKDLYQNLAGYSSLPDDKVYLSEDHLNHRHLVAAINGLFDRGDFAQFTGNSWWETHLIRHLSQKNCFATYLASDYITTAEQIAIRTGNDGYASTANRKVIPEQLNTVFTLSEGNLLEGLKTYAYPDFGLYLLCSKRLYLAIRCGPMGQNGNGGHAHNDQLSIELNIDGQDLIVDPGTYLYTPLPTKRNLYRSIRAHYAPRLGNQEPGQLDQGLFTITDSGTGCCIWFGNHKFIGKYKEIELTVQISERTISLKASSPQGEVIWNNEALPFSDGYGRLRRL